MAKILVPLDGSQASEQAIPVALELAREHDAEILLQTVTELPESVAQREEARRTAERHLAGLAARLGWPARTLVLQTGDPVEGILHTVESEQPDMVVMVANRRSGIASVVEESVAEQVRKQAAVPVRVVDVVGSA